MCWRKMLSKVNPMRWAARRQRLRSAQGRGGGRHCRRFLQGHSRPVHPHAHQAALHRRLRDGAFVPVTHQGWPSVARRLPNREGGRVTPTSSHTTRRAVRWLVSSFCHVPTPASCGFSLRYAGGFVALSSASASCATSCRSQGTSTPTVSPLCSWTHLTFSFSLRSSHEVTACISRSVARLLLT